MKCRISEEGRILFAMAAGTPVGSIYRSLLFWSWVRDIPELIILEESVRGAIMALCSLNQESVAFNHRECQC